MDILEMTRKEFEDLPLRKWDEIIICNGIIILPGKAKDLHDSGYRCMDFVAVQEGKPTCRLSGSSDVIHIEGIGGFRRLQHSSSWLIDCLPKSGLLRLRARTQIICGPALSSFEVYTKKALKEIRDKQGKVCDNFELCNHRACQSSYSSWHIANEALKR